MALTYGFYNSIEGDRVYDAIQFGRIFDGIIKDGVYATYEKGMMVIASSNPAEVIIQPGRAWFNHTWSYNDANVIFEAPAPEVLLERYDALVLEINEELSSRENSYKWVTGTPSSRPERPTLTNTSTIHQYPLCYVHRYPETTMIYTRDITNMIGTSECPFATGVLEGIDLDAWINQWDDEFHTWENSKKTQFEAWMLSQETAFTAWYNAFKNQMASDVQEVEDFVDYLKSVLDASTAIHLQEEIDDLKNEISSGSHITVTTINPELYGRNVTITESGGTVFTEKFDNTGVAVFKSVPYVGNLTISSTYGTQTAERVVNTPYYARYEFAIAFWAATVNIVGDPEMSGSSVTVKDSNESIVGTVVLDSEGTGVYTAMKPDTYKFTLTYGGETMEVTLSVTQETTYTVDLHAAGFKWQDWLEAGGVTGSYSSLDDVLADEVALRRLFTVHASVDYMASISNENEDIEKIINCDLAAKWINLRDYALDTLYANETIAGYMDTADKYFYGEWTLQPQVPTMTSNTAPYGTVTRSSIYNSAWESWKAFDGDESTRWIANAGTDTQYIEYEFVNAVRISSYMFKLNDLSGSRTRYGNIYFKASNDGQNYVTLDTIAASGLTNATVNRTVDNDNSYTKYRIEYTKVEVGDDGFVTIQFYAWQPKGNVPVMTSNTAPYGVASASSEGSGYGAWKAFDGNPATDDRWSATSSGTAWVQYKFVNPVCAKKMFIYYDSGYSATCQLKVSNNGSNWVDLGDSFSFTSQEGRWIDLDNSKYYLYYRVEGTPSNSNFTLKTLQFYGRELSSLVPLMTSNTTPYGEAKVTNAYSAVREAWKSFAGPDSNSSLSKSRTGSIQYKFTNAQTILFVSMKEQGNSAQTGPEAFAKDLEFYVSDDDSTWTKVGQGQNTNYTSGIKYYHKVANPQEALYFRVTALNTHIASGDPDYLEYGFVQFYGLDYSEKEFEEGTTKKWLYDHGVELETIENTALGGTLVKGADSMILTTSASGISRISTSNAIDITSYSLERMKLGKIVTLYSDTYTCSLGLSGTRDTVSLKGFANSLKALLPNNVGLDISSVNESVYPWIYTSNFAVTCEITEWWLE